MREPAGPPPSADFDRTRRAAGSERFVLRLESLEIEISGLDPALVEMLRGGTLAHAANAVHDGKGYLFYGESGAGKSTSSASNRRRVVRSADARRIPRTRAFSEIVGNLPFVAEAFDKRPDLFQRALSTFADLPLAHLHFAKDDRYWDAIEAAGF